MKKLLLFILLSGFYVNTIAQPNQDIYKNALLELESMLTKQTVADFKKAVFLVENCYYNNQLSYQTFCDNIDSYKTLCQYLAENRKLQYSNDDYSSFAIQAAAYTILTDSFSILETDSILIYNQPFEYDFENTFSTDPKNSQVSTLITTHKGNCKSLPYLYKLIVEECSEKAYLAFAPNHMYIKAYCKEYGWYNIELTSSRFPTDAWLMASGYIHLNAIQNGIYMDTLSLQQSIAACVIDLAQSYEYKFGINDGTFILNACKLALQHYPNYINALLYKVETKLALAKESSQGQIDFSLFEPLYAKIHNLGYRKMPDEMYLNWLVSLKNAESNEIIKSFK